MEPLMDSLWRVYHERLRPHLDGRIIEVQTTDGRTVIPWTGFDDSNISKTVRLGIARRIVRLHNEQLNRDANAQFTHRA